MLSFLIAELLITANGTEMIYLASQAVWRTLAKKAL